MFFQLKNFALSDFEIAVNIETTVTIKSKQDLISSFYIDLAFLAWIEIFQISLLVTAVWLYICNEHIW